MGARTIGTLVAATILLAAGAPAIAAPASVDVSVAPRLQDKAVRTLGARDVDRLAAHLRTTVARRPAGSKAYDGARIELVLLDAAPNHPTPKQLHDMPHLSTLGSQIGGVLIEGRAVAADGAVKPIRYLYNQNDIFRSMEGGTWADAQYGVEIFARQLARGEPLNTKPIKVFNAESARPRDGVVTLKYHDDRPL